MSAVTRTFVCFFCCSLFAASVVDAQVLGTFRWRTEPFCNVLVLTVTQTNGIFTLDGFDEQCGGNPRQPVHGIAVPQANGTVTLGLNVVMLPAGKPVNIEAGISLASVSGTWRDSAGNAGALTFAPAQTSGGPRTGPVDPTPLPGTFFHTPNGNFVITAGQQADLIPIQGAGSRMVWHAGKSAFRVGRATAGEWDDAALGNFSFVAGFNMSARGRASMALGEEGNADGANAVAIGSRIGAEGPFTLALGTNVIARTTDTGAMILGDHSSNGGLLFSNAPNQFTVRAAGGYRFFTNAQATTGARLEPGSGAWSAASDVALKENFVDVDGDAVLGKLARMPIREWNYKAQDAAIRHVGPTAQDFHAAFGLGEDTRFIGSIDADGINLAAVKALEARTRASDEHRQALEQELATLRAQVEELTRILTTLGAPRQ